MAGVLTFDQYLGGPDQLIIEQAFPSNQRSVIYNYDRDVSGYVLSADYQTIVVDTVKFNRFTGAPNFSDSRVIGSFDLEQLDPNSPLAPRILNAAAGAVLVTFPADMYTGPIIPDARKNVPIVVFGFTWQTDSDPPQRFTHRWAFLQAWEPDVVIGNPVLDAGFTELL